MCKKSDGNYWSYDCKCSARVGGCNNPRNLCDCTWCECGYTLKERQHEVDRINQFEAQARDDAHFRQKIFNRAAKCGQEKRERFITFLKEIGRQELASFVEMTMKQRGE